MDQNEELKRYLASLPGIGPRQATRIIYYLLKKEPSYSNRLADLIGKVRNNMRLCQETFHYFYSETGDENLSPIATDPNRDHSKVLIIETESDLENIEKIGTWRGTYFVLGGRLKPSYDKNTYEQYIRLSDLKRTLQTKLDNNNLSEVILALGSTVEGDFTDEVITEVIASIDPQIKISRLARGLSTGTSLEYVDKNTFEQALEHRD